MAYNQILTALGDFAGVPMAIIMSMSFLSLIIYLTLKLPTILTTQNVLIQNNTEATRSMSKSVNLLGVVLQEITKNSAVHDERTQRMQCDVDALKKDVSDIRHEGATKAELAAIHGRLDVAVQGINVIQCKVS